MSHREIYSQRALWCTGTLKPRVLSFTSYNRLSTNTTALSLIAPPETRVCLMCGLVAYTGPTSSLIHAHSGLQKSKHVCTTKSNSLCNRTQTVDLQQQVRFKQHIVFLKHTHLNLVYGYRCPGQICCCNLKNRVHLAKDATLQKQAELHSSVCLAWWLNVLLAKILIQYTFIVTIFWILE